MNSDADPAEIIMLGGFVNDVVRVGNEVRRPRGPWTPAVHALLHHLERVGFAESPRVLGIDAQGRERLSFIEGTRVGWSDGPEVMRAGDGLAQLGDLLRRYHEAVRGFTTPEGAVWRNPLAPRAGELIRHGDFSPFNIIWRESKVVGVIDWDFAQPGDPLSDLAYLAWYSVPLMPDDRVDGFGLGPIDRSQRLRALCSAYGEHVPDAVVEETLKLITTERKQTAELARRGIHPWTRFASDGNLERFDVEADWIRQNRLRLRRPDA